MKDKFYKILTLSAMSALLATACSDSSTGSDDSNPASHTSVISSNDNTDDLASSSSEEISSSSRDADSSSSEEPSAESSSSEEDASSSSEEAVDPSSSEEPSAESSSSEVDVSSSSEEAVESSSSEEPNPTLSAECLEMRSTQDKFIPLEDVFDCILPKEKVVFVIRHGERKKEDSGTTGDLNAQGKDQSSYLGKKMGAKSSEEFYYISTKSYRTLNTDVYISKGKGETFLDSATVFSKDSSYHFMKSEDYTEKWFVKNSTPGECKGVTSWAIFSIFAYDTTACSNDFYNVDERSKEFIDKHFMYDDIQNVTVVATHDKFITPFLISLTDRKIGFEAHEYVKKNGYDNDWNQGVFKHWPNYLAGVAIIVNENDERAYVPVKGLQTGYLGYHCLSGSEDGYTCSMWEKDVK